MFSLVNGYSLHIFAEDGYTFHNPLVVDCNLPPPVLAGEAPLAGCGCADCPRACTLNLPEFKDFNYDFYIVQGVDGLVFIMIIGKSSS